ncbi:DNA primase [Corynebacterium urealyticum]|nr:DNA primase [Corynebacterium urealyticum]TYR19173.1 DNA primase [Corynebacterium urealyticum]
MPDALTARRAWVRADGKRPITASGAPASSTDASTWADYAEVQSGAGDGFGVMLGGGLGCYDLDGCLVDGQLVPWAEAVLDGIAEPIVYVEVSMSGSGVHVFVEAEESPGYRRGGVERYTRGRFIRMTGKTFVR